MSIRRIGPILCLALALLAPALLPAAARAGERWDDDYATSHDHHHGPGCGHEPVARSPGGRYEWRTVERRVPGRWEREWIPSECVRSECGMVRCRPARWSRRWIPAQIVRTQEWVWVHGPRPGRGRVLAGVAEPLDRDRDDRGWR